MKKRYGEIVKEMYAPVVDPDKQREIEMRYSKLHHKARKVQSNTLSTRNLSAELNARTSPVSDRKKRPKVNLEPPESEPEITSPKSKAKDYLQEQRKGREAARRSRSPAFPVWTLRITIR